MATADVQVSRQGDWIFANPWLWTGVGVVMCLLAGCLQLAFGEASETLRVVLITIGLILCGIGLIMRFQSAAPAALESLPLGLRTLVVLALIGLFGLIFLASSFLLLGALAGLSIIPWHFGALFVFWTVVAPLSMVAVATGFRRIGKPVRVEEERAALFALAAVAAFVSCWALYDSSDPLQWDKMRLFLATLAVVAFVAAPLAWVSTPMRRFVLSLLILFHFSAITTAVLSAPAPEICVQIWTRIYRPYLEFMYLNNAYHFYSPEPGPASYLWFRLLYEDDKGMTQGVWYKIPGVGPKGVRLHTFDLEYQRYLCMTEVTTPFDGAPPFYEMGPDGMPRPAEYYKLRASQSVKNPEVLGLPAIAPHTIVPFHPTIQQIQQYQPPVPYVKTLLQSYARFVCEKPHPEHPEWKIKGVKIYRVRHEILPLSRSYILSWDPDDPELYRPFFMGDFAPNGQQVNLDDPFLYWLLPILRESAALDSSIKNYAVDHAGDPNWVGTLSPVTHQRMWGPEAKK